MTTQSIPPRLPRVALAVRTVRIARALHSLTPEAVAVRLTPVTTTRNGVPRTGIVVLITDNLGHPVGSMAAHRLTRDVLRRDFTRIDWTRPHLYEIRTGRMTPMAGPFGPSELAPAVAR